MKNYDAQTYVTSSCVNIPFTAKALEAPTSISINSPASAPYYDNTPQLKLSGNLVEGVTYEFFSDSNCTHSLGDVKHFGGTYDYLTTSALTNTTTNFFLKASGTGYYSSGCLATSISYTLASPPIPSGIAVIDPSSAPYYDTSPNVEISGVGNGLTIKLYSNSECSDLITSGTAYSDTKRLYLSNLNIGQSYEFYATSSIGTNESDCSTAFATYLISNPLIPTGITISNPSSAPYYDPSPNIEVSGVADNLIVKVYSDSGCTNLIKSSTAYSNTITLYPSNLTIGQSYKFYATTSVDATESACSTVFATYDLQYIPSPTGITVLDPATSSSIHATIKVKVDGLDASDYQVFLYTDSNCTNQVGESYINSSSAEFWTDFLPVGTHTLYAKRTRSSDGTSLCSTVTTNYEVLPNNRLNLSLSQALPYNLYSTNRLHIGNSNNDGVPDLVMPNGFFTRILKSNIDGTFSSATVSNTSSSSGGAELTFKDFDKDGDDDLVALDASGGNIFVIENYGNHTYSTANLIKEMGNFSHSGFSAYLKSADFNKDGNNDFMAINGETGPGELEIYFGDGALGFADPIFYDQSSTAHDIGVGNLNGDTYPDIVLTIPSKNFVKIYLNNGDGTFPAPINVTTGNTPEDLTLGDIDNDGDLDIMVIAKTDKNINILLNDGNGSFSRGTDSETLPFFPKGIDSADMDNDGNLDVLLASGYQLYWISVLLGQGNGTFERHMDYDGGTDSVDKIIIADFDNDGNKDVVITTSYQVRCYLNQ